MKTKTQKVILVVATIILIVVTLLVFSSCGKNRQCVCDATYSTVQNNTTLSVDSTHTKSMVTIKDKPNSKFAETECQNVPPINSCKRELDDSTYVLTTVSCKLR